jgi:bleomycin hydrolase
MIRLGFVLGFLINAATCFSQSDPSSLTLLKKSDYTPIKNQANTGTCWSFSTTSLIESQTIKLGIEEIDLSEIFTVRNIYIEKAKNYILRQGHAQFGAGGLGHDVIRAMHLYGAVPEMVYSGIPLGKTFHDHSALDRKLKLYLDSLLAVRPLPDNWMTNFQAMLDNTLGKVPETFTYREKIYTPQTFANTVLQFKENDYITITSFTHHPFYKSFILEVPDNFSNGAYYNLPLDELINITEQAIEKGYTVMWDADVSNGFFKQEKGFAMQWRSEINTSLPINPDDAEMAYDQSMRQKLFENLTTQDDHLMHLIGTERSKGGKKFFLVKNSWGDVGPYKGLIHVSQAYFAINTISLVIPKAVLDSAQKLKLGIK